jgi:dTDP-4-dehydrorhamnose 3,5-epimerase
VRVTVESLAIPDVKLVTPESFRDDRGFFVELFRLDTHDPAGLPTHYPQVNLSRSRRGVVRGLHFQWDPPMGKLMRVAHGEAFLVAVDIRPGSPTLGRWVGLTLDDAEPRMVWAPAGFARGFAALSERVDVEYLCTGTYNHAGESGIRWDDPAIGVEWPVSEPVVSAKDGSAQTLAEWLARPEAEHFRAGASA